MGLAGPLLDYETFSISFHLSFHVKISLNFISLGLRPSNFVLIETYTFTILFLSSHILYFIGCVGFQSFSVKGPHVQQILDGTHFKSTRKHYTFQTELKCINLWTWELNNLTFHMKGDTIIHLRTMQIWK